MKNLRLYSISAACIIGAAIWTLSGFGGATEVEPKAKQPKSVVHVASSETGGAKSQKAVRTAAPIGVNARSSPQLAPAPAVAEQPSKTYKNPADDPASWSDLEASIYAYKDSVLGPNIKKCWHTVTGNGRIVATHEFEVVNGIARPILVSLERDTDPVPEIVIAKADDALSDTDIQSALACLRTAAAETEFHLVGLNGETDLNDTFTGHWGWRTPEALKERAEKRRMNAQK